MTRLVGLAAMLLAATTACEKRSSETREDPAPDETEYADHEPPGPRRIVVDPPDEGLAILYSTNSDRLLERKAAELGRDLHDRLREHDLAGRAVVAADAPGGLDVVFSDATGPAALTSSGILDDYDGVLAPRSCAAGADTVCMALDAGYAERLIRDGRERTLAAMRARAAEVSDDIYIAPDGDIAPDVDGIIVMIPPRHDEAAIQRLKELLRGPEARVQLVQEVAPDADLMQAIYEHARDDDRAAAAGIRAEIETWQRGAETHVTPYLRASDGVVDLPVDEARRRGCWHPSMRRPPPPLTVPCHMTGKVVLDDYVHDLLDGSRDLVLDAEHELVYEQVTPSDGGGRYWRTHLLRARVALTGADVANAATVWNSTTNQPEVLLTFDREGAETLRALTAGNPGRKLAVVADDVVLYAGVIQGAIAGGRITLSLTGTDARAKQSEARAIVDALRPGTPLRLVEEAAWIIGETTAHDAGPGP